MDPKERNISVSNMLKREALAIYHWDPLPEISGSLLGTLLIVTSILGFITSIMCYIYITVKLLVNECNKVLLKWYAIELISCFTIMLIGHMTLHFHQNIWTCYMSLTPTIILWFMASNTSMFISGTRYYTKFKAQQSQIVNPKSVITFITCDKIFCYLYCIGSNILEFWFGLEVDFVVCANKQVGNVFIRSIVRIMAYGLLFLQILASVVFEFKLQKLFKVERRSQGYV